MSCPSKYASDHTKTSRVLVQIGELGGLEVRRKLAALRFKSGNSTMIRGAVWTTKIHHRAPRDRVGYPAEPWRQGVADWRQKIA